MKSERDRQATDDCVFWRYVTPDHWPAGSRLDCGLRAGRLRHGRHHVVPAGDERDWKFAKHFDLDIPNIFEGHDTDESVCTDKGAI